jgi:allantoate deiminase
MDRYLASAREILERAKVLASLSEEPDRITRTFLSEPMHAVHAHVAEWMERAGLAVAIDAAGNIHGRALSAGRRLLIGSHLDTVPDAGMFDGILGVLLGISLAQVSGGSGLEVVGFSEEEGVRFGVPFLGSRALIGELDEQLLAQRDAQGVSVREAIQHFGLDPSRIPEAVMPAHAYLEFHIEQGPVLDSMHLPLGIVEHIVGQTRAELHFLGHANHAGTTPMHLRRDALAAAAEWIQVVEREAIATPDLVATVGRAEVKPGAGNVVAGAVTASLDVRHPRDQVRGAAVEGLLQCASQIAARRGLTVSSSIKLDQAAVPMDPGLTATLVEAVAQCGYPLHKMNSGAGHDAMVMARRMPAAMLFLRSPGGISHHPDESVLAEDVACALKAGERFLELYRSEPRYA